VRIHLAGQIADNFPQATLEKMKARGEGEMPASGSSWLLCQRSLVDERCNYSLVTYAYLRSIPLWADVWRELPSCTIVDSGAFTAHTLGKEFTLDGYAAFIDEFSAEYGELLDELHFMSLDVIGDAAATWRNFDELERRGHQIMPVLTIGSSERDIDRAAEHGYFACGGLVGAKRGIVQAWLDSVFQRLLTRAELPKVHLLGVTQGWALERYPAFSSDSSSWKKPIHFGQSRLRGLPMIPRSTIGSAEAALASESLRAELRHYRQLQDHTTALWRERGIEWES